jgi:hypothetical protein
MKTAATVLIASPVVCRRPTCSSSGLGRPSMFQDRVVAPSQNQCYGRTRPLSEWAETFRTPRASA